MHGDRVFWIRCRGIRGKDRLPDLPAIVHMVSGKHVTILVELPNGDQSFRTTKLSNISR